MYAVKGVCFFCLFKIHFWTAKAATIDFVRLFHICFDLGFQWLFHIDFTSSEVEKVKKGGKKHWFCFQMKRLITTNYRHGQVSPSFSVRNIVLLETSVLLSMPYSDSPGWLEQRKRHSVTIRNRYKGILISKENLVERLSAQKYNAKMSLLLS